MQKINEAVEQRKLLNKLKDDVSKRWERYSKAKQKQSTPSSPDGNPTPPTADNISTASSHTSTTAPPATMQSKKQPNYARPRRHRDQNLPPTSAPSAGDGARKARPSGPKPAPSQRTKYFQGKDPTPPKPPSYMRRRKSTRDVKTKRSHKSEEALNKVAANARRPGKPRMFRSNTADNVHSATPENMSVRELKQALAKLGVSDRDCIEKSDLVAKLTQVQEEHRQKLAAKREEKRNQ